MFLKFPLFRNRSLFSVQKGQLYEVLYLGQCSLVYRIYILTGTYCNLTQSAHDSSELTTVGTRGSQSFEQRHEQQAAGVFVSDRRQKHAGSPSCRVVLCKRVGDVLSFLIPKNDRPSLIPFAIAHA